MDRQEYQEYTEQLQQAIRERNYEKAAMIADRLPWDRCKHAATLCRIADVYEHTEQYEKSQKLLFLAYEQDDTNKTIVYRLGLLAVKMGQYIEAENCYDKFVSLAPKDPNRYILKYRILQARLAPIRDRIAVLEAYKNAEYLEEWGYELALLYHEAGMETECVEECDDLILWFSESEYAYRAMELKSRYKQLSDMQIERYSNKFGDTGSLMGTYATGNVAAALLDGDTDGSADAQPPDAEDSAETEIARAAEDAANDRENSGGMEKPPFDYTGTPDGMTPAEQEELEAKEAELISAVEENRAEFHPAAVVDAAEQDSVLEESKVGISEDRKLVDSLKIEEILDEWDRRQELEEAEQPEEEPKEEPKESTAESELDSLISEEVRQLMAELEAGLDSAVVSGEISMSEEEKKIEEEEKALSEAAEDLGAVEDADTAEAADVMEAADAADAAEDADDTEAGGGVDGIPEEDGEDVTGDTAPEPEEAAESEEDIPEEEENDAQEAAKDEESGAEEDGAGDAPVITTILDGPKESEKKEKKEKKVSDGEEEKEEAEQPVKKPVPQDTGFIIEARYDLDATGRIGTKVGLNEDQTQIFSYFVPVRGMSEQIVEVLNHDKYCRGRAGSSRTGNILVIGHKGSGKTVLAVDVVKAIQKQRRTKGGKVAIVNAASLNRKNISDIFLKLKRGALIIEQAGKLHPRTVEELNAEMEKQTEELLILLEEEREPLKALLRSNVRFARKFTAKLEIPIFTNDELVTFAQTYAKENGYKMDDLAILALYSRIDAMQKESHSVSITEVKDVMDEAMTHSRKAKAKKFIKRLRGKSEDEEGRILLNEKDFV